MQTVGKQPPRITSYTKSCSGLRDLPGFLSLVGAGLLPPSSAKLVNAESDAVKRLVKSFPLKREQPSLTQQLFQMKSNALTREGSIGKYADNQDQSLRPRQKGHEYITTQF